VCTNYNILAGACSVKACEDLSLFTPVLSTCRLGYWLPVPARSFTIAPLKPAWIISSLVQQAKNLFETRQDILLVHTTGRGAMEAASRICCRRAKEILSVCNGKFGEMFAEIAEKERGRCQSHRHGLVKAIAPGGCGRSAQDQAKCPGDYRMS